ncbi:MAG TPA: HipA domain-containing protein [Streptosporangiaceae bacterium]|jgi:serine/threonine-protein kinase HipA
MTSDPAEAFVWAWLPDASEPVAAGRLDARGEIVYFTYGRSYLDHPGAIPLYLPELPLRRGRIRPLAGLTVAGCIHDAGPDAWGQRVILQRHIGRLTADSETGDLSLLTYLLGSGSDRIGALDFQVSATAYEARASEATLSEMVTAADRLEAGLPLPPQLGTALLHGTSVGGARPKVLLNDGDRRLIAKLSSRTDPYPVVKAEAVAMELARRVGLDVARTEVTEALGRDVLLVDRFDRPDGGAHRRMVVSALTILGLDVAIARYATYYDLADAIRSRFAEPGKTLRELFSRITFNICVSNTDDHARNHAAFWDGQNLTLTPAYDICPQLRSGGEATQTMAIRRDGYRYSQLAGCIAAATDTYLLSKAEAKEIIDHQVATIRSEWNEAADAVRLTATERSQLWGRQILNPYSLQDSA